MRIVVPYTKEVIDSIIYEYQEFFWPFQFVFILLTFLIIYSIWSKRKDEITIYILAFFYFWIGAIYEIKYYNQINWIGFYVGSFFILQALLLLWFGILKKQIKFKRNQYILSFALFLTIYFPTIELLNNINLYEISIVGMLPNITIVFSILILSQQNKKIVYSLFIIPIIWIIFSAYWNYLLLFT